MDPRPSIEHSSFQLDCGCLPEDLSGISSRYRTASATEDHPSRKEKSFADEDESYSDDYDSDYETDPAAKIDDTMKGTVLAVAVTKKVDRRSCSMSRSMEASPQRQSGENIIAISFMFYCFMCYLIFYSFVIVKTYNTLNRAPQSPAEPHRVPQSPTEPHRALQSSTELYRALQSYRIL